MEGCWTRYTEASVSSCRLHVLYPQTCIYDIHELCPKEIRFHRGYGIQPGCLHHIPASNQLAGEGCRSSDEDRRASMGADMSAQPTALHACYCTHVACYASKERISAWLKIQQGERSTRQLSLSTVHGSLSLDQITDSTCKNM